MKIEKMKVISFAQPDLVTPEIINFMAKHARGLDMYANY